MFPYGVCGQFVVAYAKDIFSSLEFLVYFCIESLSVSYDVQGLNFENSTIQSFNFMFKEVQHKYVILDTNYAHYFVVFSYSNICVAKRQKQDIRTVNGENCVSTAKKNGH